MIGWEFDELLPHIEDDLRTGAFEMANKYRTGKYQARMIADGYMQGYYMVVDTEVGDRVVYAGHLSLDDAYADAFERNATFVSTRCCEACNCLQRY